MKEQSFLVKEMLATLITGILFLQTGDRYAAILTRTGMHWPRSGHLFVGYDSNNKNRRTVSANWREAQLIAKRGIPSCAERS